MLPYPGLNSSSRSRPHVLATLEAIDSAAMITHWQRRLIEIRNTTCKALSIFAIYLASELLIWGLSLCLVSLKLQYLSSIFGMIFVFSLAVVIGLFWNRAESLFHIWIKPRIDLINAHVGVAFPVPIVMLDETHSLDGHEIARVIGTFLVTNIVGWTTTFATAFCVMYAFGQLKDRLMPAYSTFTSRIYKSEKSWRSKCPSSSSSESDKSRASSRDSSPDRLPRQLQQNSLWAVLSKNCSIIASIFLMCCVGIPLAASGCDQRVLDGCVLWAVWLCSIRLQRALKTSASGARFSSLMMTLAVLANPVLLTIVLMVAFTRVKAVTIDVDNSFAVVLRTFSAGTPLYALWTAAVENKEIPGNSEHWFGAGDAALSILECGILIWGFKLYECRRQLFSVAGVVTVIVCVAVAGGNVYLSVLTGKAMGLAKAEALAFAARNTTLALAKPAMDAVSGNTAVNAALVVTNGILGQLLYPSVLDKLNIQKDDDNCRRCVQQPQPAHDEHVIDRPSSDEVVTIAAGITIGVNGAAMGVAYLYETKSRAAPYAALAMTVYGVMTLVFTTVGPFQSSILALVN